MNTPRSARRSRKAVVALKKRRRRIEVGPVATFYFECYETMLQQVQEMLHIEKGGEAQIEDELRAYNPLIPQGAELTATVMFEIDDPVRRAALPRAPGRRREHRLHQARRRGGEGPARRGPGPHQRARQGLLGASSSTSPSRRSRSRCSARRTGQVILGFSHPEYSHMAVLPEEIRAELAGDFA